MRPYVRRAMNGSRATPILRAPIMPPEISARSSHCPFRYANVRAFGKATILENNIVQTTGSAGESVAGGVIFTLPALIFLGFPLEYSRIFLLALIGGWLGVFFMIPLRRQLIVKEHGTLLYPEGTACADVLIAGDKGGSFAGRVFMGLGLGSLYTLFQNENLFGLWPSTPDYQPKWYPGSAIRANTTTEYLG